MTLISDCFSILENAINTKDDKEKFYLLRKGIDKISNFIVNYHDENTIELNIELWYKYAVEFYSINQIRNVLHCAEQSVKAYDNADIQAINAVNNRNISLTLKIWYYLGFLLYGDCLLKLVDKEMQERLSQIKLLFSSI